MLPEQPEVPVRPAPEPPPRLPGRVQLMVGILLAIPLLALGAVPLYSRSTPKVWGFPFFYWYQLVWVLITPVLTYSAYVLIKRARGER
jgi:hypothetical protein